jgi:MinD-like ATPase involved in chromosome partitioning or flagellar assembly
VHRLVLASGKGGVGTSIVAALTALSAAERDARVLLVDATEASGAQHQLFGVRPSQSLWSRAAWHSNPDDALIALDDNLTLVAGGTSGNAPLPGTDEERRAALRQLTRVFANYDTIIIDGGSRLDTVSALIEITDGSLMLVTSADRLALAANYALVKAVRGRRPETSIAVLANRHGEALAEEACEFLVGACSHFLGRTIDVVGALPDDPCLQAAIGAGMTVRDALGGSPAAESMRGILSRVIPSQSTAPRPTAMTVPSSFSRRWS